MNREVGRMIEMPKLANILVESSSLGMQAEVSICIQLEIKTSSNLGFKNKIRARMAETAQASGVQLREKQTLDAELESLTVEVQGNQEQVSSLYSQLPRIIEASKVSHRLREDLVHGRGFEFKFSVAGEEIRICPVYVCILWIRSAEENKSSQYWLWNKKNTDIFHSSNSFVLSQQHLKMAPGGSTVSPSRSWVQASLASIHELTQKPEPKEWRSTLKDWKVNHSFGNIRFNYPNLVPIIQQPVQPPQQRTGNLQDQLPRYAMMPDQNSPQSDMNRASQASGEQRSPVKHQSAQLELALGNHIVRVQGIDWRKTGQKEVCNLFTNYGNIDTALCTGDGSEMYLCYGSSIALENAIQCLDGFPVDGIPMRLMRIRKEALLNRLSQVNYSTFVPRKRFSSKGPGLPNKINPVSRTLHVTFHHDSDDKILVDSDLLAALSHYGQPIRIKRESSKKKKNMWFVEFLNEAVGAKVLMKQHNQPFQGGTLRISFTKTL